MVCKIVWLPRAIKTYISNIEYLKENWSNKEVRNFMLLTESKLTTIAHHPKLGSARSKKFPNVRFTLIHKRVALIYKYNAQQNEIELMLFWNTYQHPRKIKA